jgi:replicative DNA helicase
MANDLARDALAEQALLASIFNDPVTVDDIADLISPIEFFEPKNELLYSTILKLRQENKSFDPVSLASHLKKEGTLDIAGGILYISELLDPSNLAAYGNDPIGHASTIKENYRRRQLTQIAEKISEAATLGSGMSAEDATLLAEKEIFDITNEESVGIDVHSLQELYPEAIAAIYEAKDRPEGVMTGLPSGFPDLDKRTNGFRPGQLIFVAARPGLGKAGDLRGVIPTPTGTTTFGKIKEGDEVFGADGKIYKVLKTHPVVEGLDSYEILFSDGAKEIVSGEHLWYTETRSARKSRRASELSISGRDTVLPEEKLNLLRAELALSEEEDTITLVQLANLFDMPAPYKTMVDVAAKLNSVGQTFITKIGTKSQKVFNAKEIFTEFADNKRYVRLHEDRVILDRIINMVHSADSKTTLTVKEVANTIFGDESDETAWFYINKIVRKSNLSPEMEMRPYEQPVKKPHVLYNKKELLGAYLAHGEKAINDQRHKNITGSVKTTLEIKDTLITGSDNRWNHSIPVTKPLQTPAVILPITPYTYGAWLGDGDSHSGSICGIDHEIFNFVEAEGYISEPSSRDKIHNENGNPDFRVVKFPSLKQALLNENLIAPRQHRIRIEGHFKYIPKKYFLGSIEQRKNLLAGLMDTDGTVLKGSAGVQFTNTNYNLIEGVYKLAVSLGYRPMITKNVNYSETDNHAQAWNVNWSTDDDVFRITRKVEAHRAGVAASWNAEKNDRRYIVAVNKVDSVPMRCITVDSPDHLFLIGDALIPTHNSTLAVDFCRSAVFLAGKTVLFFSLEMSAQELTERVISAEARVELQRIRSGDLSPEEWMNVNEVEERFKTGTFLVDASPKVSLSKIRSMCLRQKMKAEGLDMIVVDYLQLMEVPAGSSKGASRQEQVSELSRGLKLLAKELQIPIIVLSQLNRNSETRTDRVPQVSDLRESGSLEQDADLILLIHRPEVGDENNRPGEADLIIGKQRSGPLGKIPLTAMLSFSKFVPGQGIIEREPEMAPAEGAYTAGDDETPW